MPPRFQVHNRALWRSLSWPALARLLVGVFFIFATLGFVIDIFDPRSSSFAWVLVTCVYSGAIASVYVLAIMRGPRLLVLAVVGQVLATMAIARLMPHGESLVTSAGPAPALQHRLYLDGVGVIAAVAVGWAWTAAFVNRQALDFVLATFELTIAQRLQADLVPRVALRTPYLEMAGRSEPSSQMGGDVVDAVELPDEVVGYVADVSGHGIAAGVLMAVVKSAVRTHLLTPQPLSSLLTDLNAVLPALKDEARYVTLAAIRVRSSGTVEFALAGHLPILHFVRRTHSISRLSLPQVALGLFGDASYTSANASLERGDVLVLLTDGLTETVDSRDEEFGIDRLESVIAANSDRRADEIVEAILAAVRNHGRQADDQSVLVLVARDSSD